MLGYESAVVNGQLVNVAPAAAFDPIVWGPVYTGAAWQRQGVYVAPPVASSAASNAATGSPTNPFSTPTATASGGNPFHLTKSPVIWVLVFLAVSLVLLHTVHYKG